MIIVKVELHSARTGKVTELGRMHLSNTGEGTPTDSKHNYLVEIMRKGTTDKVQRQGLVRDYPRQAYTVWELVRRALVAGLGKWPIHPGEPEEFDEQAHNHVVDWNKIDPELFQKVFAEVMEAQENPCKGCEESFDTDKHLSEVLHKSGCKYYT